jgi:hypothetical protein
MDGMHSANFGGVLILRSVLPVQELVLWSSSICLNGSFSLMGLLVQVKLCLVEKVCVSHGPGGSQW